MCDSPRSLLALLGRALGRRRRVATGGSRCASSTAAYVVLDVAHGLGVRNGGEERLVGAERGCRVIVPPNPALPEGRAVVQGAELRYALDIVPGRVRVLDVSGHRGRGGARLGIPGSVPFEPEKWLQGGSLPRADVFASALSQLGVSNDTSVVVYDRGSPLSSSVAWWLLRLFGHKRTSVLSGGLDGWLAAGGELGPPLQCVTSTRQRPGMVVEARGCLGGGSWKLSKTGFQAQLQPPLYKSRRQVVQITKGESAGQICQVDGWHDAGKLSPGDPGQLKEVYESAGIDLSTDDPIVSVGGLREASLSALSLNTLGRKLELCPVHATEWRWGS